MGKYQIEYTETAIKDLQKHKKAGNSSNLSKIQKLIDELKEHPETGTGKPEQLKGNLQAYWSRRINQKDRLIYKIENNIVTVTVISAMGHYSEK
jgi:toxin YoeB